MSINVISNIYLYAVAGQLLCVTIMSQLYTDPDTNHLWKKVLCRLSAKVLKIAFACCIGFHTKVMLNYIVFR